jgi:hypothetical protein
MNDKLIQAHSEIEALYDTVLERMSRTKDYQKVNGHYFVLLSAMTEAEREKWEKAANIIRTQKIDFVYEEKRMSEEGYQFAIVLEDGRTLYAKSIEGIQSLMRNDFKDEKNWFAKTLKNGG